jgi:hypothetical protein
MRRANDAPGEKKIGVVSIRAGVVRRLDEPRLAST